MNPTALLTVALFLAIAPSPGAEIMSEITAGFLKADRNTELAGPEFNYAHATRTDFTKQHASVESLTVALGRNGL